MIEAIQQLEAAGITDDTVIADYLSAVTKSAVSLDDLLYAMNNRGMLIRRHRIAEDGSKWAGTIKTMLDFVDANGTDAQKDAVGRWFSHITNDRNKVFSLNDPQFAVPFSQIAQAFGGQPGMPSAEDFGAIIALGGGLLYPDGVTVKQIQQARDDHAAEQAQETTKNRLVNALSLFNERITAGADAETAGNVWVQAWSESEQ